MSQKHGMGYDVILCEAHKTLNFFFNRDVPFFIIYENISQAKSTTYM